MLCAHIESGLNSVSKQPLIYSTDVQKTVTPFQEVLDHQGMVTTGIFLKRKEHFCFIYHVHTHIFASVGTKKWHLAVSSNDYSKVQFISLTNNPQVVPPFFFNIEKYFKMVETGLKVSLKSLYNVILTSHCLIQRPAVHHALHLLSAIPFEVL